jgi:hypothetical protein
MVARVPERGCSMTWVAGLVVGLVLLGSLLAIAESSISRMTRVRAGALR